MAGAFCFILIQLVLLIDFAHSWNESWVEKMEEGNSRCWYAGMVTVFLMRPNIMDGNLMNNHPRRTVSFNSDGFKQYLKCI